MNENKQLHAELNINGTIIPLVGEDLWLILANARLELQRRDKATLALCDCYVICEWAKANGYNYVGSDDYSPLWKTPSGETIREEDLQSIYYGEHSKEAFHNFAKAIHDADHTITLNLN